MLTIKISQWKGKRNNHSIINFAARFFTQELLGPHMASRLNYHIRLRSDWAEYGCVFLTHGKARQRDFEIRLKLDDISKMLFHLAHEIVHIEQRIRNKIVIQYRDNGEKVWFNDDEFLIKHGDSELSQPWELDACKRGDKLIDLLIEHTYEWPEII